MGKQPTKEQKRPVKYSAPIILLIAFGGTGKTDVITWFVLWQLALDPKVRILMVTLTNAAAYQMEKRLGSSTSNKELRNRVVARTLHSFATAQLYRHAPLVGFTRDFEIEPGITKRILKRLLKRNPKSLQFLKRPLKTLEEINTRHLNTAIPIATVAKNYKSPSGRRLTRKQITKIENVLRQLREGKRKQDLMDYEDVLYLFWQLIQKHRHVLRYILAEYPLLVVDEFQDTTEIQFKVLKVMMDNGARLFAAGDPCQVVYRFAGASFDRFRQIEGMSKCTKFTLTRNFRMTRQVLTLSNAVLAQCPGLDIPKAWSKKLGPKPQVILGQKGLLVKTVLEKIRIHQDEDRLPLNKMAILYRFGRDAAYLKDELEKLKLPYVVFERGEALESEVVDFVFSIVGIVEGRYLRESWREVLSYLSGVGEKGVRKLMSGLKQANYQYEKLEGISPKRYKTSLKELRRLLTGVRGSRNEPAAALNTILGYYSKLSKRSELDGRDPGLATMTHVANHSDTLDEFEYNYYDSAHGIFKPSSSVNLPKPHLVLSNIHQAKTKQFEVVFVLGSYDSLFKGYKTFRDKDQIKDEILVMNTAVTRCAKHLYLLFPMTYKAWEERQHPRNPSIFIRNCPRETYDLYSVRYQREP